MSISLSEVGVGRKRPEPDEGLGEEVAKLRHECRLTQAVLADRLGLSLEGYRMYEKGYSKVRAENLWKWARALGLPATEIAKRLEVDVGVEPDVSDLVRQVSLILGPDKADMVHQIVSTIADLPPEDQRVILVSTLDQIGGARRRLDLTD